MKVIQRNPHVRSLVAASFLAFALAFASAAHAEDPYIESLGLSGISTGYRMKGGISRVEVDFQLSTTTSAAQWRIFGDDAAETKLQTFLYITGSGVGDSFKFCNRPYTSYNDCQWVTVPDTDRHLAVTDLKNKKNRLSPFPTNATSSDSKVEVKSFAYDFAGLTANLPLSIFGRYTNTCAAAFQSCAKVKIYGVKIYENYDESSADNSANLVHNFVPCLKDGETPCFKDLVGGGFIVGENPAAFTASANAPTYLDNGYVSTAANADGGKLYIDTGYTLTSDTAVEVDCAMTGNIMEAADNTMWYVFDGTRTTRFQFNFCKTVAAGLLRYSAAGNDFKNNLYSTSVFPSPTAAKDFRHLRRKYVLDNYNGSASVMTSGFTNRTVTFTKSAAYSGANTIKIASYIGGANYNAPLKIYGCRIFEAGELVRDFVPYVKNGVPGLRCSKTGTFVPGKDATNGDNLLAYGGTISGEQDAYIESNGSTGMNTGYKMKGNISRVEMDFQLVTTNASAQWRLYGTTDATSLEPNFITALYLSGQAGNNAAGAAFYFRNRTLSSGNIDKLWTGVDADRHTAGTDLKNKKFILTERSPVDQSFTTDFSGVEAKLPLSIFGAFESADLSSFANGTGAWSQRCAKMRIYSVRFYENYVEGGNNTPIRELIPYSRGGVVGFYDTVTGEIVKNDNAAAGAFTFGGAGSDHGNLNCYLKPGYATKITHGESQTKTLTAYAPGATSYKWFRDGQLIDDNNDGVADGADGMLPITWARGGTKIDEGYLHTYQAVAVFNLYGVERESELTPAASITSIYLGTTLLVR